jgi:vancomycin permeability regulator SanA
MLFGPLRLAIRIVSLLVAAILIYLAVSLVQVWLTSSEYDPHPAAAILVMGAAEYNGTPTNDLRARLGEAVILFRQGDAHLIVVTGSKEKGDLVTEAGVSKGYLVRNGVPAATRTLRARPPFSWPATPRRYWSPPTPSMSTGPWPSPPHSG